MKRHKYIRSKMKKNIPLLKSPMLIEHVPETVWFDLRNLQTMLSKYKVVYIKPDTGKQGNKIIRVEDYGQQVYRISTDSTRILTPLAKLPEELKSMMSAKRKYVIQQGIDLATVENCPFDIRMVLQKVYSAWTLTLTSAKVALSEDAVVTNVSKGAEDYPLLDILQIYDQKQDPLITLRELVDLAHQVADSLAAHFPLIIIGLDLAVDKAGKVWFIEANTRPQCERCQLVNDEFSRQKYERARTFSKREGKQKQANSTKATAANRGKSIKKLPLPS